jgi:hypothetical protein
MPAHGGQFSAALALLSHGSVFARAQLCASRSPLIAPRIDAAGWNRVTELLDGQRPVWNAA